MPSIRNCGHKKDYSKHDDVKYIFNYKLTSKGKDIWQKLMIPVVKNKLFTIRTSNGYTSFFKWSSAYASEWGNFSGACHKIPEDDNAKPLSDQPPQSHDNMSEFHKNPR